MSRFTLICLGGALGTGARYFLSSWMHGALGASFPFGTLAVNVIGSFLIAVLMFVGTETSAMTETTRIVLTTGIMGGFTTYSTFSYETMRYVQAGAWAIAALNVTVTLLGCLGACFAGWAAARWLVNV